MNYGVYSCTIIHAQYSPTQLSLVVVLKVWAFVFCLQSGLQRQNKNCEDVTDMFM